MVQTVRRIAVPALIPCLAAGAYLVLLIVRFPQLIAWENADSDVSSAYVLTDAVVHGHAGQVVMSTQGSWVPLWYGLATHGLSFHRVLWEISPALLVLATAVLIGWSVSRVSTRAAAALAAALVVAASPTALFYFTSAFFHNTTVPGVAILGAYLVWMAKRPRAQATLISSVVLVSVIVGTFLASDELLGVVGVVPFLGAPLALAARDREWRRLIPVLATTLSSIVVAIVTTEVMTSFDFRTTTPDLRFTRSLIPSHVKWLVQGLLRMGNGLSVAHHAPSRTPLVVAAGIVTLAGLAAMLWLVAEIAIHPAGFDRHSRARDVHILFWASSFVCAAAAYVVTTVADFPTDRYFMVAVPAVAATVPLLSTRPRGSWMVATGATIFIVASIVSLAARDVLGVIDFRGADVPLAARIESLVRSEHLGVGYAGYWNAASLDWSSHERLRVYPLTDKFGHTEPMYLARVDAWYRPRRHTASYLVLAPGDFDLADKLPSDLPSPARQVQLGAVTVAIYPYDIAAYLHPPHRY